MARFGMVATSCLFVVLVAVGCKPDTPKQVPAGDAASTAAPGEKAPPGVEPAAATKEPAKTEAHETAHEEHDEAIPAPSKEPLDVALGAPLTGATAVTVDDLFAKLNDHVGATVAVEGEVVDQCFHARGWFAIKSATSDLVVRLVTAPGFKVPKNALGSHAKAEGVVVKKTLDPKMVKHYEKIHKFIPEGAQGADGTIALPTITCTGATFKR